MLTRIRSNLPRNKPQLWENLGLAARRRISRWWHTSSDPSWLDRPLIVALGDHDLKMEVVPRNHYIDGLIYSFGTYEISGTRFLQSLLRPGMSFVDVGANGGYYSLLASRLVGKAGRVDAFEPVPRIRRKLVRNLELNGASNVVVHDEVVADRVGTVGFFISGHHRNDGTGSTIRGASTVEQPVDTPSTTLDQHFPGPVDLVKIDTEGSEHAVLRGAERLLTSPAAPALLFESYDAGAIASHLESFGYSVRALHYSLRNGLEFYPPSETFHNVFSDYEGVNFVALPPGDPRSFGDLAEASRARIPLSLRLLARLA